MWVKIKRKDKKIERNNKNNKCSKSENEKEEKKEENKIDILTKSINYLNKILQEGNFVELSYILGNKKEMFIRNFFAGIGRGIGIGIGVTVITAILVIILQKIVTLNIPIIGEYIADIVEIVQKSR